MPIVKDKKIPKTRLDFRVSIESKTMIEQAASLSGQTVSDFAVSNLVKVANEIIETHQQTRLSNCDRDIFLALIDNNEEPNSALKNAAKNYKKRVNS